MASMTISASSAAGVVAPARARVGATRARAATKSPAAATAPSVVAKRITMPAHGRLPSSRSRRGVLQVRSAGLPPNLAGMMGNMDPEKIKEIQAAYEQAMKDPETAKKVQAQMAQMQGMMGNPMVAKQMAAMNNMISNPDMQKRIAALKDDPDFQPFFEDVQKNGPSAMMKYSNDAEFLKKLNEKVRAAFFLHRSPVPARPRRVSNARRSLWTDFAVTSRVSPPTPRCFAFDTSRILPSDAFNKQTPFDDFPFDASQLGGEDAIRAAVGGDVPVDVPGMTPAQTPAAAPTPDVETLHDAARYGDVEAVEDFIAIGKDVNARDSSQRTPLHYAIAFGKGDVGEEIFNILVEASSDLTAVDEKKNTPLHYACGYGKVFAVRALLEKGADTKATNGTGKTPLELVKLEAKNPINEEADLLEKLAA